MVIFIIVKKNLEYIIKTLKVHEKIHIIDYSEKNVRFIILIT